MSTDFFRKYINIIEEAQQLDELSPDLLRRASDAATARGDSLTGPENKAARQKARGQEEKFYQGQVDRSNANPVAGTQATANAYAEKLKQNGWNQITNPQQIQQAAASLGWDKYSQPPQGVTWFTHSQSGEAAYIDPKNGQLVRSNNTQQRVGHSFGNAKSMHPAASDSQKWNANNPNQNIFQPTEGVAENANVSNIKLNLTGPQAAILLEVLIGSPESKYYKKYVHPITAQLIGQGITAGYDKRTLKQFGPSQQGVAEEYNGNVKDTELKNVDPDNHSRGEGEFVKNQLHTMKRVITHLDNAIGRGEDLPDWVQSEIAQAVDKIVGVMDYSISSKEQDIEKHTGNNALMKEQGIAEEELDEAGTPDAVRRIEQLVQYK
jgi:hypothetical protein